MMARPTCASWRKLKKLARYLRGQPRVVQKIKLDVDGVGNEVKIVVDSGWAGCSQTRKSTNGGCIMVGDVCLKAWSTTQRVVALSSGEAEYYAAIKGASEGLCFLAGCADLGIWTNGAVSLRVLTDSSACKGICQRTGLGMIRHIDVAMLWLQDLVRKGKIQMSKIPGKENSADLLTKYLPGVKGAAISRALGFYAECGRSNIVDAAEQSWRLSAMGRWSRGGVSAAQTVIALKPTASRAGRERPRPPAMTLVVGTTFKGQHSEVAGESTVRPLPLHRVPLHRDIFQSELCCRVPRQ